MKKHFVLLAILLITSLQINLYGQALRDRLKSTVNSAAQGVGKAIQNKNAPKEEPKQQQPVQQQEQPQEQAQPVEAQQEVPAAPAQPALQTYSKYDFVPGEKVIFFDDFSQDVAGDFPALWNTNGSAEVVTTNLFEGKWMKFDCDQAIWSDQPLSLPENFTIEFDVVPTAGENGSMKGYTFRLMKLINLRSWDPGSVPGKVGFALEYAYYGTPFYRTYVNNDEYNELHFSGSKDDESTKQKLNQKYHIAVWVQKSRVRVYQNETKLFDLPRVFNAPADVVKMDRIRFENGAAMVTNIRIAVGTPDTRSKLITEGKLVTYGIYFDVNKDVVKPESYGTLKEIATVLSENPGVRVKITGHTDSDGADAANLDLSKRRAESVKNELSKNFGIDASRIETEGAGETKPIAPNDNSANKALNRRVEFVKL